MPNCSVFSCKMRSETSTVQKEHVSYHITKPTCKKLTNKLIIENHSKSACKICPKQIDKLTYIQYKHSKFPKIPMIRDVWMKACANHVSWTPKRTSTICSQHFEPSCFITQAHNKRKLKECAVPTLKLPKVERCEESRPATSTLIKIETFEDSLSPKTQECIIIKEQPHMSQSENHNLHLCDTPKTIKLRKIILMKNKKIKRLQSQIRYLKKKVDEMQEVFNELSEKSLINKENRLVQGKNGVEEKEKSIPILE